MAGIDNRDQRDLVLAPGEYAHIMDKTKGQIATYAGPTRASLSNTDEPIRFNGRRFERVESLSDAVQPSVVAPEGYYILLKNPAKENAHPQSGTANGTPALEIGHKIIVHGPASFVPWPGQMTKVVKGHHLRSNQYLLVRVYDEKSAQENWNNTVVKSSDGTDSSIPFDAKELTTGKTLVIKGTDVSFYMPSTGIEVVPDEKKNFVREAVTLERLEYCVLIDESGTKRNERGPAVVFPEPTEVFKKTTVVKNGAEVETRKFRAYELTENSGIHLKIIAPYKEGEREYKVGEELFITGKEQMIYFPREEQAIVKYEGREIHYAPAIPKGEARYVMDRNTGEIILKKGPCIFLPDPRTQIIVRKALDPKFCQLLYPGNSEALQYNMSLAAENKEVKTSGAVAVAAAAFTPDAYFSNASGGIEASNLISDEATSRGITRGAARDFGGDAFNRKQQYTPPRTITLNTKYDGAVTTRIWAGYAVMLVSKSGQRRVVQGPQTVLHEFDEDPQVLTLSTGTPKSGKTKIATVYLRTTGKVSDQFEVETNDYCKITLKVSYRINFEGDPEKWFSIEDYVGFLADHLRSRIRNGVQKFSVQQFTSNSVDHLRDMVLGKVEEDQPRPGLLFKENGMKIYDLDVLFTTLQPDLEKKLVGARQATFENMLNIQAKEEQVKFARADAALELEKLTLAQENLKVRLEHDLERIAATAKTEEASREQTRLTELFTTEQQRNRVAREKIATDQMLAVEEAKQQIKITLLRAEVEAVVAKAAAVSPDLCAAMNSFGQQQVIEQAMKSMAPLALLGGNSVADVVKKIFEGTVIAEHLKLAPSNGTQPATTVRS